MSDSAYFQHFKGNLNDDLAAGNHPVRVDRTGMFLCLEGKADIVLDDIHYELEQGMICVYFPYSMLYVNYRSDDLDGIAMTVDLDAVQPLLNKLLDIDSILNVRNAPVAKLSTDDFNKLNEYIRLYMHHVERSKQFANNNNRRLWQLNKFQAESLKECLMLQIVMAFTGADSPTKGSVNRKDEIVQRFLNMLRLNYRKEHEVKFYADSQYLSMRYFSCVVRERTSRTPSQWIAKALLTDAKQLLVETDKSVKEVSEILHFPNQSYFGKWFKAHTGRGPVEFKRYADKGNL